MLAHYDNTTSLFGCIARRFPWAESFVPVWFCRKRGRGISDEIVLKVQEFWNDFRDFLDNLLSVFEAG